MSHLHLDIETYSECDLKSAGVFRYAEHPSTELLCFAFAFDDKPVWLWKAGDPLPQMVINHISQGGLVVAHNAQFERVVLNGVAGQKVGFPHLSIRQMRCTAAKMAAAGLPRALGDAAAALQAAHVKSAAGKITMLQLCKPRKKHPDGRYTPQNSPQKFADLYAYNIDDVESERAIDRLVPDLSPAEQEVYWLDQEVNERGIAVDIPAIENIQAVISEYKDFLEVQCAALTGAKPSQREAVAAWVRKHYPPLTDMQADTVRGLLKDPRVPEPAKKALRIYSTYGMKAVTKYDAILAAVCADGRLRGMFLYHGANTGRWSSLIVQLQNLFRPVIEDPETAVEAFSARSLEWIQALYTGIDPLRVAASCVRSVLTAAPGKTLQFLDYAGIESRVNAWVFDEAWKLQAYRDYDAGRGPDMYKLAYARAFQVRPDAVSKSSRQIGKVMELALGYEGGVNAFNTMVATYGIDLDEMTRAVLPIVPPETRDSAEWMWENMPQMRNGLSHDTFIACDSLKRMWRDIHPHIVQGWKDLKSAAELAVQFPGKTYMIPNKKIMFRVVDRWLYMRLPSGRKLAYFSPRWEPPRNEIVTRRGALVEITVPGELRYWGVDTYTRQYMEITSYGGRWCENLCQAISRDILVAGLHNLEAAGYATVGTVHDEVIQEVDASFGSIDEAAHLMCAAPAWAAGLPLAVEGKRSWRYAK